MSGALVENWNFIKHAILQLFPWYIYLEDNSDQLLIGKAMNFPKYLQGIIYSSPIS